MSTASLQAPSSTSPFARRLNEIQDRLRSHALYDRVRTERTLRVFVEHHVICVLDFMSLLKSLQRDLTCVRVPWTPTIDPDAARLIGSIVLDEETDTRADGRVQSHFAWYVEAMREIGADVGPIEELVGRLEAGGSLDEALRSSRLPEPARDFGRRTAGFLGQELHVRAAVFFHGREEIIPGMFLPIVKGLAEEGLSCEALQAYLERHIEIDGGEHGPLAERMLQRLYDGDPARLKAAEAAALESLASRERLWDAIARACV